jgi:hypothetical protein
MRLMMMIIIIMGHECKWGTAMWGVSGKGKGKDTKG